jgi:hypothetical protein
MNTAVSAEFTGMAMGLTLESSGTGYVTIASVAAVETPPPGAGVVTVICAFPSTLTSAAMTLIVNVVAFTYVVWRVVPFH